MCSKLSFVKYSRNFRTVFVQIMSTTSSSLINETLIYHGTEHNNILYCSFRNYEKHVKHVTIKRAFMGNLKLQKYTHSVWNNKRLTTFVVRRKQKSAVTKQDSTFWNISTKVLSSTVIGTKLFSKFEASEVNSLYYYYYYYYHYYHYSLKSFTILHNFLFSLSSYSDRKENIIPKKARSIENHWKTEEVPLSSVSGFSRDLFLILFTRTFLRYRGEYF